MLGSAQPNMESPSKKHEEYFRFANQTIHDPQNQSQAAPGDDLSIEYQESVA